MSTTLRIRQPLFITTLSLTATLAACADGGTAGVSIQAVSRTAALTSSDAAGTSFTVSAASAYVRDIRLDLPEGLTCGDVGDLVGARCEPNDDPADDSPEDTIIVDGPFVVDLLTGAATPSLAAVRVPAGTYRRVDVRLVPGQAGAGIAAGAALDGNAVAFTASYQLEGQATPVDLRLDLNEDIRVEATGGIEVADGDDLAARFVVGDWLSGVTLTSCLTEQGARPGEPIVLDDASNGSCSTVENALKDNFKRSGDLDRSDD